MNMSNLFGRSASRVSMFFAVVLALLILPSTTWAQMARLTGIVTDASGAAVPSATVTAKNTTTGIERSTETSSVGTYTLPGLVPSTYNVTFAKSGFKAIQFVKIVLTIDQTLTLDGQLQISSVQQTIEVSGSQTAPVDLEDAQISNVVDGTQTKALPLILRDPYQLVLLSPGEIQSNTRLGGFSANGQREMNNNFLIDGMDNNDTDVPGGSGGLNALNPDSVQEFRVITNNFAPEFGRDNGAIVDVKSPSGTNTIHGDAYWFGRYDALGARDFFNHQPDTPKNPYERNIFGGSVGGPLIHDKTFWFANYEAHRFITTLTNVSTVPTDAFKTGVFTYTYTDPTTNLPVNVPIDVSTPTSANNALGVPLDSTIHNILALYHSPNAPGPNSLLGYYFYPSSDRENDDDVTVRVDHQLTKNNSLFVRYLFARTTDPNSGHSDFLPGNLGATALYARTQNAGFGITSVISPRMTNEFRLSGNRTNLEFSCTGTSVFDSFGFGDQYGRGADFNLPSVSGFGCLTLGDSNGQARFTGTYEPADNLTYVRGNHTFKFGAEFRDVYSNGYDDFSTRTTFGFEPYYYGVPVVTGLTGQDLAQVSGNPNIDDLIGSLLGITTTEAQNQYFNAASHGTASDERGFRQKEWGLFAQDSWKLKPNLTVTYGLRWEYYGVPYEVNGNFSSFFGDATTLALSPGFSFTTLTQGGKQVWKDNYRGFDPRIGLAWDPFKSGKTSIRAGYGIFRDRIYGNLFENTRANPPFLQQFNIPSPDILSDLAAPTPLTTSNIVPDFSFLGPALFDPNFQLPYSQNWNLGIQEELKGGLTVEVNYVGVHGIHEGRVVDLNPPQPSMVNDLLNFCVPGNPLNTGFVSLDNPGSGQCDVFSVTSSNLWVGDFFGTLPDLGPAGSGPAVLNRAFADAANSYVSGGSLYKSIAKSHYNGLQVNLTKRYSHGFQAQLAYTYSHSLDDASDPLNPATGNRAFPRNSFNLGPEYGNSDYDVRHRAVLNFVYDPDIGRGKGHLSNGFVGRAFEGWEISAIGAFQTGLPYDVFGFRDTQHTGFSDRATIVDASALHKAPTNPSPATQVFTGANIAAFADDVTNIPWGIPSNFHRNQFFGPGMNNWDAVLAKDTSITERLKFELRFEFYNLFNRVQFGQPDNAIADTNTFGFSTSQVGRPDGTTGARQIQFAAKLKF